MRVRKIPDWLPREGESVRFVADGCEEANVTGRVKAIFRFFSSYTVSIGVRRSGNSTVSVEPVHASSPDEQFRGKWKCTFNGAYVFGMVYRADGSEAAVPDEYCGR